MELKHSGKVVDINAKAGINLINDEGSSGKSYLKYILDDLSDEAKVGTLTYDKNLDTVDYINKLRKFGKLELLFIDRFDMYSDKEILEEASNISNIVLVDWKNVNELIDSGIGNNLVNVDFDSDGVYVV